MPSILGQWFSLEVALRALVWATAGALVLSGLVFVLGFTLRRRRREIGHLSRMVDGPAPSHDALRKWCFDRFLTAANAAQLKRGTPEGLFAADDCRYWHTLIDILDARVVVDPRGRLNPPPPAEDVGGLERKGI